VLELETSVFVIPGECLKNGKERLVVLNRVAKSVIESMRGRHPIHVFVHARGKGVDLRPVTKINNTGGRRRASGRRTRGRNDMASQRRRASGKFAYII
jgi:hypothetical protein